MKAQYVPAVGSLLIQLFATAPMSGVHGQAEKDPPNLANSTVSYSLPSTAKYDYAEVLHKVRVCSSSSRLIVEFIGTGLIFSRLGYVSSPFSFTTLSDQENSVLTAV